MMRAPYKDSVWTRISGNGTRKRKGRRDERKLFLHLRKDNSYGLRAGDIVYVEENVAFDQIRLHKTFVPGSYPHKVQDHDVDVLQIGHEMRSGDVSYLPRTQLWGFHDGVTMTIQFPMNQMRVPAPADRVGDSSAHVS